MSLNYTTVRLWWDGRRGQAQCDGVSQDLEVKPELPFEMYEVDYCKDFGTAEVRHRACDRRVDLEPHDVEAVRRWLHCFAQEVKR